MFIQSYSILCYKVIIKYQIESKEMGLTIKQPRFYYQRILEIDTLKQVKGQTNL